MQVMQSSASSLRVLVCFAVEKIVLLSVNVLIQPLDTDDQLETFS